MKHFRIEINSSGKLTFWKICSSLDQYEMLHIDMNVYRILNDFSQAGYARLIVNNLHVLFLFQPRICTAARELIWMMFIKWLLQYDFLTSAFWRIKNILFIHQILFLICRRPCSGAYFASSGDRRGRVKCENSIGLSWWVWHFHYARSCLGSRGLIMVVFFSRLRFVAIPSHVYCITGCCIWSFLD